MIPALLPDMTALVSVSVTASSQSSERKVSVEELPDQIGLWAFSGAWSHELTPEDPAHSG